MTTTEGDPSKDIFQQLERKPFEKGAKELSELIGSWAEVGTPLPFQTVSLLLEMAAKIVYSADVSAVDFVRMATFAQLNVEEGRSPFPEDQTDEAVSEASLSMNASLLLVLATSRELERFIDELSKESEGDAPDLVSPHSLAMDGHGGLKAVESLIRFAALTQDKYEEELEEAAEQEESDEDPESDSE